MGLGRDWDETGAGLGQFETVFLSKEIAKSRQKSHIEYINPNSRCFFQFGSVAQSVARLLCNWKVRIQLREKYFFQDTWNLA